MRFTTRCHALTAGLSLTLNLTTNSTIPVSQPLSCVSLSCANLSLSLTSQISQWSSSIETTLSDKSVNRKLQVLNVSGFIKFKSKQVFHKQTIYKSHIVGNTSCRDTKKFLLPCFVLRKSLWHRLCPPLTSQCCTSPRASAGCQRSAPMT